MLIWLASLILPFVSQAGGLGGSYKEVRDLGVPFQFKLNGKVASLDKRVSTQ